MGTTSKMERKTKAQRTRKERWIRKARSWNQNLLKMEMLMMRVEGQEGQVHSQSLGSIFVYCFSAQWHFHHSFACFWHWFGFVGNSLLSCSPPICCLGFSLRSSNILGNMHRTVMGHPIKLGWMLEALYPFGRRLCALLSNVLIATYVPIDPTVCYKIKEEQRN